jgi:ABC-type nitrate/sulfonate/bicarbonate transport system substrate-binding protein
LSRTARASWLGANEETAVRYLRALLEANAWGADAANSQAAVAALIAARYTEAAAMRLVQDAVPALEPSQRGWDEVVSLRRECGLLPSPEPDVSKVVNAGLLARASKIDTIR